MLHKTVKATATATDEGIFSALAAAYTVDRSGERIIPGAFKKTIEAWRTSGKAVPLHWDHEGSAASIIGYVDPTSMEETEDGLYVEGRVDIETSDTAKEAWRSMKNNAVSLSFGYLPELRKGKDGITEITSVDLFEISIVPAPANADTRILSLKSAEGAVEEIDPKELRRRSFDAALEVSRDHQPTRKSVPDEVPEPEPAEVVVDDDKINVEVTVEQPEEKSEQLVPAALDDPLRKRTFEVALGISNGGMKVRKHLPEPEPEPEPLDAAALRRRCDELALDIARS